MTTEANENLYRAQHVAQHQYQGMAVFNPLHKPVDSLPVIYGFNNGGIEKMLEAALIAEDGTGFPGHLCSHEAYMPADLGCLEGTRSDRHVQFRGHYPEGYRMAFVGYADVQEHEGITAAFGRIKPELL